MAIPKASRTYTVSSIMVMMLRLYSVNVPVILGQQFVEHWTAPVTVMDNLDLQTPMSQFQVFLNYMSYQYPKTKQLIIPVLNLKKQTSIKVALLIILAGDVASNAGPYQPRFPCLICNN